ncbi:MAG: hypothetical protein AABX29_01155, partial [Nanoarchaeota archaeon]
MKKRGKFDKKYDNLYFSLAIALILLSILVNMKGNNITGLAVEQIYNFGTPIEGLILTTTSTTSSSTIDRIITSTSTLSTTVGSKNKDSLFGTSEFFAQAAIDTVYDFQGISTPSSTFNATNGTTNAANFPPNPTSTSPTNNGTEVASAGYTSISTSNNARLNLSGYGFAYGGQVRIWQIFKFKLNVTHVPDIQNMTVLYEGYAGVYGGPTGFNLSIWNNTASSWLSLNMSSASTPATEVTIQRALPGNLYNLSDFIYTLNGINYTFLSVITNGTNSSTNPINLSTDYVSLTASVTTTTTSSSSSTSTLPRANLTLYLTNSSFTGLYRNITAFTNDSVNITSKEPYPADVNMTLYVTNYAGVNASFNYSKSFLQNITNFWTEGNYLINITWEGNLTLQPNSTAFYVTVLATTTTSSSTSTLPRANLTLYLTNS